MSGFQHAPVSLGLMLAVPAASLLVALLDCKPWVPLVFQPHLTKHLQLYRIPASCLVALDSSTLLLYVLLVYHTSRRAERLLGSRKFASYLILVLGVDRLLSLLVLAGLHGAVGRNSLEAGPWVLVAAVVGRWWSFTPGLYTIEIAGITLGDKLYPAVLAVVMACSAPIPSLIAGFSTHLILSHPLLGSYLLPTPVSRAAERVLMPLLPKARPPTRSSNAWPEREPQEDARRRAVVEGLRRRVAATAVAPGEAAASGETAVTTTTTATTSAGPAPTLSPTAGPPSSSLTGQAGGHPSAMSQWVSVLSASVASAGTTAPARVPSEQDVAALAAMFPDAGRASIVRALTDSDFERDRAVERLLAEG